MSTLRERMDRLCEVLNAQDPVEIKAVMSGATEDLCASDILERLRTPGSPLPAGSRVVAAPSVCCRPSKSTRLSAIPSAKAFRKPLLTP